jgi:ubiquinone/menaquinone biosynthesis C-methylase UbiE
MLPPIADRFRDSYGAGVTVPSPIAHAFDQSDAQEMRDALFTVLAPQVGERILEVGAGCGCYALEVAAAVSPGGTVDIVDGLPDRLEDAMHSARVRGLDNVSPTLGDGRYLPFGDAWFDAAYMIAALGDVPDQPAALAELARVLRPGGRLIIGELHGDPHRVDPARLRQSAAMAGLRIAHRFDRRSGYVALLAHGGG